jgi:uncharacterized RDD family membrane protein YckC
MPPPPPGPGYGYTPQPAYGYTPQPGYTPQASYGGFWIRFVAYIIDALIVGIPLSIVSAVIAAVTNAASNAVANGSGSTAVLVGTSGIQLLWDLVSFVIEVGYFAYFWSMGSTIGMRIFRLRVVDANSGQPIGLGRALLRYLGFFISALPCWIGLIWAAFDGRKQGWHDKIANTVVLQG